MPITRFLEHNARTWGEDVALIEVNPDVLDKAAKENPDWKELGLSQRDDHPGYRKTITWKAFDEEANRVAQLLRGRGFVCGEKIAVLMMNCIEWLPIYFGILKSGCVAVPMNFRFGAEEIAGCLALADCAAIFFGTAFVERMENARGAAPCRAFFFVGEDADRPVFAENFFRLARQTAPRPCGVTIEDAQDAAIYFSSGTTGFPKAILHSHAALVAAARAEQAHHGQTRDDVFLCIPPLYHTGAKMHWFGSLLSGSVGVLLRGTQSRWILETASKERATIVWLLVPWAQDILDALESGALRLENYDLSRWRLMHIGAQPVPPSLVKRWKRYFPEHEYDTNYGLSESAGPGCVHLGTENIAKVGAIGVPGWQWQVKIVDENNAPVRTGGVGELAVRGGGVMRAYYNDPEATAAVLRDGWLFTGDMATQDADGFIYLVDRKKDVIISGGENLYPVQIEDFLRGMPQIKDVAVIGLPDTRLGEIAAAIIELRAETTLSAEEIDAFCAALPRYKRPKKLIFAPVPRNATGKIEKPRLRSIYAGGSVVQIQISN